MQYLGFNYRITDIQCALACSQMDKINLFINRRKQLVRQYDQAFKDSKKINLFQINGREQSSHHIYVISINFKSIGLTRNQILFRYLMLTIHAFLLSTFVVKNK